MATVGRHDVTTDRGNTSEGRRVAAMTRRGAFTLDRSGAHRFRFANAVTPFLAPGITAPSVGPVAAAGVNGASSLVVTAPAVPAGTLLVLVVAYQSSGTAGIITAAGWDSPYPGLSGHATGTTGVQMAVYFRTASGTDTTFTVTGTNVAGRPEAVILGYPGASVAAPVKSAAEAAFTFSTASAALQTGGPVTTAGDRWLVMVAGNRGAFTYTPGTGMTERVDLATANTGLGVFDSNGIVPAGAGLTRTATASGSSSTGGRILFALQAA